MAIVTVIQYCKVYCLLEAGSREHIRLTGNPR